MPYVIRIAARHRISAEAEDVMRLIFIKRLEYHRMGQSSESINVVNSTIEQEYLAGIRAIEHNIIPPVLMTPTT
ncbi:hypothetical protein AU504_02860 [Lonsdalea populi]|nr:hypothetical protein AU508_14890 [Lonsdalea populi]RAT71676.1 hypothetical protein AU506_15710 [Lonsdalea populi]RAT72456.1 hypothetical protein AU505_06720 [Lonsdalea populi]RAT72534.1 hypothetical protein AU504_02860 [Lonsdalea populi]RAT78729.1 hypothetical protein AU507_07305 [Lonsdalea populi]